MDIWNDLKVILASSSPSRKLLLERLEVEFEVVASGVNEDVPLFFTPEQTVTELAQRKANAIYEQRKDFPIIAADSIVNLDGKIIGKPQDREDAKRILSGLSGKSHEVVTGVCIIYKGRKEVFFMSTEVEFYELSSQEIEVYVNQGESDGRAGGYGIEGKGALFIKSINGDYSNIVGLPVAETFRRLRDIC